MKYRTAVWTHVWLFALAPWSAAAEQPLFRSHPPTRPLPAPSNRALAAGPAFYVDPNQGDDRAAGAKGNPWKTLARAVTQLKPGDTLYLRGGTYFEHVTVTCSGAPDKPITIRAYSGELAVVNGGLREFMETPQTAWEPCPEGVAGEFRSVKTYLASSSGREGCHLLGNFADSMVPLEGYRFLADLRDPSMAWDVEGKVDGTEGVYCGPGVYLAHDTGRIHIRLAHTTLKALGEDNYRGETDPRKLPLVIAGVSAGPALAVREVEHVRFQDLVVCGARTPTIQVSDCRDVSFEGLTVFGGYSAFNVQGTTGLRLYHTACRGIAAPWTFRGHLKYRSVEARIFSAGGWTSKGRDNQDFELAYSEFTDSVDGVFIGNVKNVHFHHNLLDNVSDDGLFLTAATAHDGTTHGGDHFIYQNLLRRSLTTLAFGVGHGRQKMTSHGRQTGSGVWIYRNVFDLRRPVHYQLPGEDDDEVRSHGRVASDHGGPAWEPINFYQNTLVETVPNSREYYLADLGGHMRGSRRRLFNNIAVQVEGMPGRKFPTIVPPAASASGAPPKKDAPDPLATLLDQPVKDRPGKPAFSSDLDPAALGTLEQRAARKDEPQPPLDFQADGNLHWSSHEKPDLNALFQDFRQSTEFAASKRLYSPGWASHDVVADPQFVAFHADWKQPLSLQLSSHSPAVEAGVELPSQWPDPLREADRGKPDLGALPKHTEPWRIGVRGRLTMFGVPAGSSEVPLLQPIEFPQRSIPAKIDCRPVALVQGYPARDGELLHYALVKHGIAADVYDRTWLDTKDYARYGVVVIVGDLVRAQMTPHQYTPADLERLQAYLEQGGTLLLMRAGRQAFDTQHGRYALGQLVGGSQPRENPQLRIRDPDHPWLKHLDPKQEHAWIQPRNAMPLRHSEGEAIIGSDNGHATLLRVRIGRGQLIYLGWEVSEFQMNEEQPSSVEQERMFEEQMQLLENVVVDLCPVRSRN